MRDVGGCCAVIEPGLSGALDRWHLAMPTRWYGMDEAIGSPLRRSRIGQPFGWLSGSDLCEAVDVGWHRPIELPNDLHRSIGLMAHVVGRTQA